MYLWKVEYNPDDVFISSRTVVNCFELCIFEKLNTTFTIQQSTRSQLWIALNYVSLKSWIQPLISDQSSALVVNCFELCIFEKLNTTKIIFFISNRKLWIALNYVSLKSWIQRTINEKTWWGCCELLWIMYLWKVEYNYRIEFTRRSLVVNCFELCIFEKLNTTMSQS